MTYEYAETDLQIHKAALNNNWDDVCGLFRERPELKTKPVNVRLETPLMIAVGTNSSHEFVKQLLNNVTPLDQDNDKWYGVSKSGNNVLHYAAKVGNIKDARLMAGCLPLTMVSPFVNIDGYTPVLLAAKLGRNDMIDFIKDFTIIDDEKGDLVITAIQTGYLDLALLILNLSRTDEIKPNTLEALATKPEFFPSGNRLGFWGGLISQWMPIIVIEILAEEVTAEEYLEV